MRKKIGLLTFPTVTNHGGYLQAFATFNLLKERGYEVSVINYRNKSHLFNEYRALFIKKNIKYSFINLKRFYKFRSAQKRFLMDNMTTEIKKINTDKFDIVIVGADIVWNYDTPFVGKDPIYFGKGLEDKFLISYAASMGNSDKNKPIPEYVTNGVKNFSCISVRDQNSINILDVMNQKGVITLDPCLIYDYSKFEIKPNITQEYILVYAFEYTDEDILEIKTFAKNKSLKIISIGFNTIHNWCDENIMVLDPLEFLGYYRYASYVFTSTFHGTLFAIKYKKNFALRMNFTIERKVNTILEELKLTNQVIDKSLKECWENNIDYTYVDTKMVEKIKHSQKFLFDSIEKFNNHD